jgi:hypothetical protein
VGTLEFGVELRAEAQKLVIDILRVFDLKSSGADTYCKCTLMPDKISYQTRVVRHAVDPVYEEQFEYDSLDSGKLDSRYLELGVYEIDKATSKDECIGITILKLNYPSVEVRKIFLKDFRASPPKTTEEVCFFLFAY